MRQKKIYILTLFPEMFDAFSTSGVIGKALTHERSEGVEVSLEVIQIRDYADNKHRNVDHYPFGGGSGMVMRADVLAKALNEGVFKSSPRDEFHVVYPSPRGKTFENSDAKFLAHEYMGADSKECSLVLICGRYEGIDERFLDRYIDDYYSLGNFILTGGELACMVMLDASLRFVDGILGNRNSNEDESFQSGLIEYPQYTKPRVFEGVEVPEVLLSGHHKNIKKYQDEKSLEMTQKYRPDLWRAYHEKNKYLALIHNPIINKRGEKVTTSVTNLDIHDIARSCRTFGFRTYFIVTPIEKQKVMVEDILEFWRGDVANDYNPDRYDALSFIETVSSVDEALEKIKSLEDTEPVFAVTGANFKEHGGKITDLENHCDETDQPLLLGFGTGWGLHDEVLQKANFSVEPIYGLAKDKYNHLSVRSAVAIYLSQFTSL